MTIKQKIKAIKETGILPGSYFPSVYYPKALATEDPAMLIAIFREHVEHWLEWYPQDAGTSFYASLCNI